jgi:hypothetical protein
MIRYSRIVFILSFIYLSNLSVFAESSAVDSNFFVFDNKYTVMPYYTTTKLSLDLRGRYQILYRPDKGQDVGLYVAYKKMGFGFGFGVFDDWVKEPENKVRFYDFRLNYYGRQIGASGQFQFYKSFKVEEAGDVETQNDTTIFQSRPDQKLNSIGLNIYYNFNKNHSLKAIYSHTERQKKGNGAFLLGLSQAYTYLQADNSYFTGTSDNNIDYRYTKLLSITPILGYQYTFIYKHYYVAPLLLVGVGVQFQKYKGRLGITGTDSRIMKKYIINIPFGYNGDKLFCGFVFKNDYASSNLESLSIHFNLLSYSLFVGFRFL